VHTIHIQTLVVSFALILPQILINFTLVPLSHMVTRRKNLGGIKENLRKVKQSQILWNMVLQLWNSFKLFFKVERWQKSGHCSIYMTHHNTPLWKSERDSQFHPISNSGIAFQFLTVAWYPHNTVNHSIQFMELKRISKILANSNDSSNRYGNANDRSNTYSSVLSQLMVVIAIISEWLWWSRSP
jgi:hypothetical protein